MEITRKMKLLTLIGGIFFAGVGKVQGETVYYIDENGDRKEVSATLITNSTTSLSNGWYVVKDTVTTGRLNVSGSDVKIILTDGCRLLAYDGDYSGGIHLTENKTLTIYGQEGNSGELICIDDYEWEYWSRMGFSVRAGIGGNRGESSGNVNIYGGGVYVYGGSCGIGSGFSFTAVSSSTVLLEYVGNGSLVNLGRGLLLVTAAMAIPSPPTTVARYYPYLHGELVFCNEKEKENFHYYTNDSGYQIFCEDMVDVQKIATKMNGKRAMGENVALLSELLLWYCPHSKYEFDVVEDSIFEAHCAHKVCRIYGEGSIDGRLVLHAKNVFYTGGGYTGASLDIPDGWSSILGGVTPTIKYTLRSSGDILQEPPTAAGKYTASVTLGTGDNEATITHDFEIIQLLPHNGTHTYSFKKGENNTILAKCTKDTCEWKEKDTTLTLEYTVEENAPYTGLPYAGLQFVGDTLAVNQLTKNFVKYKQGQNYLSEAPTNVGDNYSIEIQCGADRITKTFSIIAIEGVPSVSIKDFYYGKAPEYPNNLANIQPGDGITYYYFGGEQGPKSGEAWNKDAVNLLTHGTYYLYAIVTKESDYYNRGTSDTVEFHIKHEHNYSYEATDNHDSIIATCNNSADACGETQVIIITFPDRVYTGKPYEVPSLDTFIRETGFEPEIKYKRGEDEVVPVEVGEYTAELTLSLGDNGDTYNVNAGFAITSRGVCPPTADMSEFVYGGVNKWHTYSLGNLKDTCFYTIKDSEGKELANGKYTKRDADTYPICVSLKSQGSCFWDGTGKNADTLYSFEIKPCPVDTPQADPRILIRTGEEITYKPVYKFSDGYYSYESIYYNTMNNTRTEIGEQKAKVVPMPNYCWNDGSKDTIYYTFEVKKPEFMNARIYNIQDLREKESLSLTNRFLYNFCGGDGFSRMLSAYYKPYIYDLPKDVDSSRVIFYVCDNLSKKNPKRWDWLWVDDLRKGKYYMYAEINAEDLGYAKYTTPIEEYSTFEVVEYPYYEIEDFSKKIVKSIEYVNVYESQKVVDGKKLDKGATALNTLWDIFKPDALSFCDMLLGNWDTRKYKEVYHYENVIVDIKQVEVIKEYWISKRWQRFEDINKKTALISAELKNTNYDKYKFKTVRTGYTTSEEILKINSVSPKSYHVCDMTKGLFTRGLLGLEEEKSFEEFAKNDTVPALYSGGPSLNNSITPSIQSFELMEDDTISREDVENLDTTFYTVTFDTRLIDLSTGEPMIVSLKTRGKERLMKEFDSLRTGKLLLEGWYYSQEVVNDGGKSVAGGTRGDVSQQLDFNGMRKWDMNSDIVNQDVCLCARYGVDPELALKPYVLGESMDMVAIPTDGRQSNFRWYHNGEKVPKVDGPFCYEKKGLTGKYYVKFRDAEGKEVRSETVNFGGGVKKEEYAGEVQIVKLFSNTLAVNNHDGKFVSYQWYNGDTDEEILGATEQYYSELVLTGSYYVIAKDNAGNEYKSDVWNASLNRGVNEGTQKVAKDGELWIEQGSKTYKVDGNELK